MTNIERTITLPPSSWDDMPKTHVLESRLEYEKLWRMFKLLGCGFIDTDRTVVHPMQPVDSSESQAISNYQPCVKGVYKYADNTSFNLDKGPVKFYAVRPDYHAGVIYDDLYFTERKHMRIRDVICSDGTVTQLVDVAIKNNFENLVAVFDIDSTWVGIGDKFTICESEWVVKSFRRALHPTITNREMVEAVMVGGHKTTIKMTGHTTIVEAAMSIPVNQLFSGKFRLVRDTTIHPKEFYSVIEQYHTYPGRYVSPLAAECFILSGVQLCERGKASLRRLIEVPISDSIASVVLEFGNSDDKVWYTPALHIQKTRSLGDDVHYPEGATFKFDEKGLHIIPNHPDPDRYGIFLPIKPKG